MTIRELDSKGFPDIKYTATQLEPDFGGSPLNGLVMLRVGQVMDASPMDLGMSEAEMTVWAHAKAMVEAAYRLGLSDGTVRLGELGA